MLISHIYWARNYEIHYSIFLHIHRRTEQQKIRTEHRWCSRRCILMMQRASPWKRTSSYQSLSTARVRWSGPTQWGQRRRWRATPTMVRSLRRCGTDGDIWDAGKKAVGACVFQALGGGPAQSPVAGSRFGRDAIEWRIPGKKEAVLAGGGLAWVLVGGQARWPGAWRSWGTILFFWQRSWGVGWLSVSRNKWALALSVPQIVHHWANLGRWI
jgi:hypothetical protein